MYIPDSRPTMHLHKAASCSLPLGMWWNGSHQQGIHFTHDSSWKVSVRTTARGCYTRPSAATDMHEGICMRHVFKYCTEEINRTYHIVGAAWHNEGAAAAWDERKGRKTLTCLLVIVAGCCTLFPMCLGVLRLTQHLSLTIGWQVHGEV